MLVRDAVHGDITLHADEARLLDTEQMQRLRGVKQLGAAYLVYPGCMHTRFDHSLGTLAMAERILETVGKGSRAVLNPDRRLIRTAALLHDVSHIPFGHTFEDERKVLPRHDTPDRFEIFLSAGELGRELRRQGLYDEVLSLLQAGPNGGDWRSDVVAGSIDADLLDYLKRDAYFAGLSQSYDERIFRYFALEGGRLAVRLAKHGADRPDARSETVHLLRMRYFLTERVYLHHAKVIAGAMISKALEMALQEGLAPERLYGLDDAGLLALLAGWEGAADGPIARLVEGVRKRRLFKRAYRLSGATVSAQTRSALAERYHADPAAREAVESEIAEAIGAGRGQVILYCPQVPTLREATMPALTRAGVHPLNAVATAPAEIKALEEQYADLWNLWVFTPPELSRAAGEAAAAALGFPNEWAAAPAPGRADQSFSSVDVSPRSSPIS